MRICFLTLDFPPFRSSGLTIYAERIVQGLAARGHIVTVVTSRRPDHARVEEVRLPAQVEVIRVPIGRADWIGFGWQAARYLRSHQANFDIIHFADVHFAYNYRGPFVATLLQSFRQRLLARHSRHYYADGWDYLFRLVYYSGARWIMERPAVQRASHLVAVSTTTRQEFIERYNVDPTRVTVIYIGINTQRFEKLLTQEEARRRLKLPIDKPILLYVGFSTPRKGLEYLAKALRKMRVPALLIIVGKWEARYYNRFISALGDERSRIIISGYVPDADLPLYYAAADVFVLPSLLEGFGIPLAEAMAAGVPVVTTTGGAASEIVGDGGLVVPSANSDALAWAIDQVLSDPDLAHQLSQAGRQRARTLFDESRAVAEYETLYYRLLGVF
ncbi:MAG: glycosyltransferase family 4 protein [Candidatus Methanomethylicaceae archaeon]